MTRFTLLAAALASCVSPAVQSTSSTTTDTSSSTRAETSLADDATTVAPDVDVTTTGEPMCDPQIPPMQLDFLLGDPLGVISHYDMDRDGELDVVSGRVVITHAEDVVTIAPLVLKPDDGVPGGFTGEAAGDLLYMSDTTGLLLLPDVLGGGGEPISTPAPFAEALDVADFDADGTDDVMLVLPRGEGVQLWRGVGDGTFVEHASIDVEFWSTSFVGPSVAVAKFDELVLFDPQGDVITESNEYEPLGWVGGLRELQIDATTHGLLALWHHQDVEGGGVGLLVPDAPQWERWAHDLGKGIAPDVAFVDLDDDGDLDVVLWVSEYLERDRFELLCVSPDGYTLCGIMELDIQPERLGVLANPTRIVLSTKDETLLVPLPLPPCPTA